MGWLIASTGAAAATLSFAAWGSSSGHVSPPGECSGRCVAAAASTSDSGGHDDATMGGTLPADAMMAADASGDDTADGIAICPPSAPAMCGDACVPLATAANCGGCANADSGAHVCSGATPLCVIAGETYSCASDCPAGQALCNGSCVDETSDPNNCGGCGSTYACESGQSCEGGACLCVASRCPACFLALPCCRNSTQCGCQGFPTPGRN